MVDCDRCLRNHAYFSQIVLLREEEAELWGLTLTFHVFKKPLSIAISEINFSFNFCFKNETEQVCKL